jgi:hypothetical protein
MRGVTYDYEFEKPDKTKLVFTGQSMPEVVANVRILTKKHYDLDFRISKDTIYNIIRRPAVAHKFFAAKIKFIQIIRPPTKTIPQEGNITINTTANIATSINQNQSIRTDTMATINT